MTTRMTQDQIVDAIDSYTNKLEPMISISERLGISRQGVCRLLKRNGIDTSNKGGLEVSCFTCGKLFKKPRCQVRKALHVFCSDDCYFAFLKAGRGGAYVQNRHGQRIARHVVSKYFTLQEQHVVHHEDRNCLNNMLPNLRVFACQGDHIRYHRGFEVDPIWDGSTVHPVSR